MRTLAGVVVAGLLTAGTAVGQTPTFTRVGSIPSSGATGISANGAVVSGTGTFGDGNFRAYTWTAAGGLSAAAGPGTSAVGMSSAADILAITSGNGSARLTTANGIQQSLGFLLGGNYTNARGISADGSVLTGVAFTGTGDVRAFRWTSAGGLQSLGTLAGESGSSGQAASPNGATVVGTSGTAGFSWTQAGGMQSLGAGLSPRAVTNGGVIVGGGQSNGGQAFRYTPATGTVGLGYLPGTNESVGTAVSADGGVVIGTSRTSGQFATERAFVFSNAGLQSLQAVLTANGVSTDGWVLNSADAISGDAVTGFNIAGQGTFGGARQAFVVNGLSLVPVPEPGTVLLAAGLGLAGWRAARRGRTGVAHA